MRRRDWGLVGVAFGLRLLAGMVTHLHKQGDAREYLLLGHNILAGHGFSLAQHAPYTATDWRMPGYPGAIALVDSLGAGDAGIIIMNALLGAAAVCAVILIARQVFADRPHLVLFVGLATAAYPSLVTFSGFALSENLSNAALAWFIYFLFFHHRQGRPRGAWFAGLFLASALLCLSRTEGVGLVLVGVLLSARQAKYSFRFSVLLLVLTLVGPGLWAVRNQLSTDRLELSDSIYRDENLLLSFDNGNTVLPLYLRGRSLAYVGTPSEASRSDYHRAVGRYIAHAIRHNAGSIASFKVRGVLNMPFVPPVWNWVSNRHGLDYTLVGQVRHESLARAAVRIGWSLLLIAEYLLAAVGLQRWWKRRLYGYVWGIALYPIVALLLTIPFHADPRTWLPAAMLLILPAAEGAQRVRHRARYPVGRPIPS